MLKNLLCNFLFVFSLGLTAEADQTQNVTPFMYTVYNLQMAARNSLTLDNHIRTAVDHFTHEAFSFDYCTNSGRVDCSSEYRKMRHSFGTVSYYLHDQSFFHPNVHSAWKEVKHFLNS